MLVTRSMKSGPGRCRRSADTVWHLCERRPSASVPRVCTICSSMDVPSLTGDSIDTGSRASVATRIRRAYGARKIQEESEFSMIQATGAPTGKKHVYEANEQTFQQRVME